MPYMNGKILQDSEYAACLLAQRLARYKNTNTIVVGMGPGGSAVGPSLAKEMNLPFDVVLCREIKHPANDRKTIGSVSDGVVIMNENSYDIPQDFLMHKVAHLKFEIQNDYKTIYGDQPKRSYRYKTVIPVCDVLTTPESLLAGIEVIKSHTPLRVIVAVPVVAPQAAAKVALQVNHFVFLHMEPGYLDENDYGEGSAFMDLLRIKNSINFIKQSEP